MSHGAHRLRAEETDVGSTRRGCAGAGLGRLIPAVLLMVGYWSRSFPLILITLLAAVVAGPIAMGVCGSLMADRDSESPSPAPRLSATGIGAAVGAIPGVAGCVFATVSNPGLLDSYHYL